MQGTAVRGSGLLSFEEFEGAAGRAPKFAIHGKVGPKRPTAITTAKIVTKIVLLSLFFAIDLSLRYVRLFLCALIMS